MTKRYFAVLIAASALAILPAQSWAITNAVVGKCRTGTQFATIQASINAADAGSTIQICSGDYPEILTITKNLTLKGVSSGKSAAVLITVPSAGVPQNATSGLWGMLAVHVLVQNASVALNNISIDGGGGTTCTLGVRPVGILFQVAAGSMANSSVVDMPQCGGNSIPAFLDLTSNFTFSSNYLSGCDRACLEVDYGSNTRVTGNTIEALTATRVGIDVQQLGGPATVANNFIAGNFDWGIGASNSSSVSITGNTITAIPDGFGISLFAQTQTMVSNNRISGTSGISVNDDGVTGGNTITKNTVVAGFCGLGLNSTSTGDTISQNTYFNDTFTTCSVI